MILFIGGLNITFEVFKVSHTTMKYIYSTQWPKRPNQPF